MPMPFAVAPSTNAVDGVVAPLAQGGNSRGPLIRCRTILWRYRTFMVADIYS